MSQDTTKEIRRLTWAGAVVNTLLAFGKMFTGWAACSQALIADGVHSLSDLATDAAVIIGAGYWSTPPDAEHPYGHGRAETIVSIGIGGSLFCVGIGVGWRALATMQEPHLTPPGLAALGVALASILIKEILYRRTAAVGVRLQCRAVVANAWHHRTDALSSVPVAVAVLASHLFPALRYLDNIAALLVTVMVMKAGWDISWPCLREIMEERGDKNVEKMLHQLCSEFEAVRRIHKVRSRWVGGALLIDMHMLVDPEMSVSDAHALTGTIKHAIMEKQPAVADVLIHVEPWPQELHLP